MNATIAARPINKTPLWNRTAGGPLVVYLAALAAIMFMTPSPAAESKSLHFSCNSSPDMPDYQYIDSIIRPVLSKAGYSVSITQYTPKQALDLLQNQKVDGDCGRVPVFNQVTNLNLIRVDPAFRNGTLAIWGRQALYDQLRDNPSSIKVGFLANTAQEPRLLKSLGYEDNQGYDSINNMVDALLDGDIDVLITYGATMVGREQQLQQAGIKKLRHLMTFPVHLFLQPRHRSIAQQLSKAISEYKSQTPYVLFGDDPLPSLRENTILFSCAVPQKHPQFDELEQFYRQVFNLLGYGFTMASVPRAREVAELNSGRVDGTCGRTALPPFSNHPHLIQIATPIGRHRPQVLTNHFQQQIQSLKDLDPDKTLAYVRGSEGLSDQHFPAGLKRIPVTNADIAIKMLAAGRIDYFIDTPLTIEASLKRLSINRPLYHSSVMQQAEYFPFLHKRHSNLVGPMAEQMRDQLAAMERTYIVDYQ